MTRTMYVIEVPRKDVENVFSLLDSSYLRDVLREHLNKNDFLKLAKYYARYEIDYLTEHTLKEWYENHIFIFPEDCVRSFIDWWGHHDIECCSREVREFIKESGLPYHVCIIE